MIEWVGNLVHHFVEGSLVLVVLRTVELVVGVVLS